MYILCYCIHESWCIKHHCVAGYLLVYNNTLVLSVTKMATVDASSDTEKVSNVNPELKRVLSVYIRN